MIGNQTHPALNHDNLRYRAFGPDDPRLSLEFLVEHHGTFWNPREGLLLVWWEQDDPDPVMYHYVTPNGFELDLRMFEGVTPKAVLEQLNSWDYVGFHSTDFEGNWTDDVYIGAEAAEMDVSDVKAALGKVEGWLWCGESVEGEPLDRALEGLGIPLPYLNAARPDVDLGQVLPHRYLVVTYEPGSGFDEKADWPTLESALQAAREELRARTPRRTRGVGMLSGALAEGGVCVYDRLAGKWAAGTRAGIFPMEAQFATLEEVRCAAADVLMHLTGTSSPDFDSLMDLLASEQNQMVESMVEANPGMGTAGLRDMYGEMLRCLMHDVRAWHREGASLAAWAAREGRVVDPAELEASWPGAFNARISLTDTGVPTFAGLMGWLSDEGPALARQLVAANPQLTPAQAAQAREAYQVVFDDALDDIRTTVALGCLSLEGMSTSELCREAAEPTRQAGIEK